MHKSRNCTITKNGYLLTYFRSALILALTLPWGTATFIESLISHHGLPPKLGFKLGFKLSLKPKLI